MKRIGKYMLEHFVAPALASIGTSIGEAMVRRATRKWETPEPEAPESEPEAPESEPEPEPEPEPVPDETEAV